MIPELQNRKWGGYSQVAGHLLLSALLLGLSFPPFMLGQLAFVAFIPVFFLLEREAGYGRILRAGYLWLFVFHCITVYWTGGFTHGKDLYLMVAGAALLLLHPLFYFPAIVAIVFVKRGLGWRNALVVIPFIWVGWEYLLSKGELSFPWLTLGNTQTFDLVAIQFADLTGVFGVSLWILWLNVLLYSLLDRIGAREWKLSSGKSIATAIAALFLLLSPRFYGHLALERIDKQPGSLDLAVIQPNIDPFEKWSVHGPSQLELLQRMTNDAVASRPDMIIWPETAIPFYLLAPQNRRYQQMVRKQVDSIGIPLLSGIPDIVYYHDSAQAPASSKTTNDGKRYDTYNSSMLMIPKDERIQKYAKVVLVPFAERVPYSEELSFLNAMKWNLGLGGWAAGRDSTLFTLRTSTGDSVRFASFICYESIFPGYVAGYVMRGAEFLTVITNDSWWGNTSGAYQHKQFAIFRAIENRRWLVRCANGGISCVIDPSGRIIDETKMYTRSILNCSVRPASVLSFYSRHGDWIAVLSLIVALGAITAAAGAGFYHRIRKLEETAPGKEGER